MSTPIKKWKVHLKETVTYEVIVTAPTEDEAEETAVEAWCQALDPSAVYNGSGEGVEVEYTSVYDSNNHLATESDKIDAIIEARLDSMGLKDLIQHYTDEQYYYLNNHATSDEIDQALVELEIEL